MCVFCGGTCSGVGDILLPSLAAGAGFVILKIQAKRDAKKAKNEADLENAPKSHSDT